MRFQACCRSTRPASRRSSEGLAFNTAMSFDTNTNWQSYVPETTMSYLVQMAGLTVHNFVSAATGIALAVALVRGFARRSAKGIGNFWVDLTRCTLYVLLPISIVVGLFFVWQGVPQNLSAYTEATTLEGAKQVIAQGPVASQEVIKMLAPTAAASSTPTPPTRSRTPTRSPISSQIVLIFSIGAALTNVFGRMVGDQRQGWAVFAVMGSCSWPASCVAYWAEAAGNPALAALGVDPRCRPAATWRARKSASASPTRRCSPPSPPTPRAAPSTPCTTASRRWAAWCRCSTSSSARSSSAASARASTACWCSPSSRCSSPG